MARHKLTPRGVAGWLKEGPADADRTLGDGGGLYLRQRPNGSLAWTYLDTQGGRRRTFGLGSAPAPTYRLAAVREAAETIREKIARGDDPRAAPPLPPAVITFGAFSDEMVAAWTIGFRNPKHRQQWTNTLAQHAAALRPLPVGDVGTEEVLAILQPLWLARPETASRLRGRIERILDAAKAKGLRRRDSTNPAAWRGHLAVLLPARQKLSRGHHRALPVPDVPAFLAALRDRPAASARLLEFTILTAARSGEARGATWGEIDLSAAVWTVPAGRMKAGREHRVPLSAAALSLLLSVRPEEASPTAYVFGDAKPLSGMAMEMLLRRMKVEVTVHGFRSCFRDWAGDYTDFPRDVAEAALAHVVGGVEGAYRRGDALEKRRLLMEAWAGFCAGEPGGNVVRLRA